MDFSFWVSSSGFMLLSLVFGRSNEEMEFGLKVVEFSLQKEKNNIR